MSMNPLISRAPSLEVTLGNSPETHSADDLTDRALGTMLGLAAGNLLGAVGGRWLAPRNRPGLSPWSQGHRPLGTVPAHG